jgi:hypothetical protein
MDCPRLNPILCVGVTELGNLAIYLASTPKSAENSRLAFGSLPDTTSILNTSVLSEAEK